MHVLLVELPHIIKGIFDILDLLVFRLTLLGLVAIGAYTLLSWPPAPTSTLVVDIHLSGRCAARCWPNLAGRRFAYFATVKTLTVPNGKAFIQGFDSPVVTLRPPRQVTEAQEPPDVTATQPS